jgi:oligopeptide transport system permease protein
VIGVLYGAIAGFVGGRLDRVMMRLVEILYGFPYVILVILLPALRRREHRPFRGHRLHALADAGRDRARAGAGARPARVHRGRAGKRHDRGRPDRADPHRAELHVSTVIVYGSLLVPEVILSESFLSFLGIGIKEPQASWGNLIQAGTAAMEHRHPPASPARGDAGHRALLPELHRRRPARCLRPQ